MAMTMVLLLATPNGAAGHTKDHNNTCIGDSSSDRERWGQGNYTHDVYERCTISVEQGGVVCAGVANEGHYKSGPQGSSAETREGAAFCSHHLIGPVLVLPSNAAGVLP
ncbi:MAG TPA: hypothetical protein VI997_08435 [Candidatus Thermoplasmatota archaeon]|nr:hypothetical protein [Candidatus Thermoplasmatota archaeon]